MLDCSMSMKRSTVIIAVLMATGLLGCQQPVSSGRSGVRNPYYEQARKAVEERNFSRAATLYQRALWVDPELAQAHLELGLLYDDKLQDPIGAIYHYRCYIQLRPNSEKRQLVEDYIDRAKISLVARLPQSPVVDPAVLTRLQNEKAALVQENMALQARVMELEKLLTQVNRAAAATPSLPPPASVAAAPAAARHGVNAGAELPQRPAPAEPVASRQHVVQRGETLQSIALRYYGTRAAWDRIYQANRTVLADKNQLKAGQVLAIP